MKVAILAGGLGTRLAEETVITPKPMIEIGGTPLLFHLMGVFGHQGFDEFVVALGYKGHVVKDYFLDFHARRADVSVNLRTGATSLSASEGPDWTVHLVDTGADTQTGGRIRRMAPWLGGETFMLTYGDGLADVPLDRLLAFHRAHGKLATVTAVRPPARFGGISFEGDRVASFIEKPQTGEGWINGGFFVLEPGILDYIEGDDTYWELTPLERLASDGQLMAFRHEGFWQPMDTLRDKRTLEALWESGKAPWLRKSPA